MVGVAIASRPVSRHLDDKTTLEIIRVCTTGEKNTNSFLYGAITRAAKALGYTRLVTYTLTTESGSSLKAAGWQADPDVRTHDVAGWESRPGRPQTDLFGDRKPRGDKIRWWRQLK
jgi:hypothetical protein